MRLDQDEVDEQNDEVMLDVFVRKTLTARTLSEPDTFSQRSVIRLTVGSIQLVDWISTFNTYRHLMNVATKRV